MRQLTLRWWLVSACLDSKPQGWQSQTAEGQVQGVRAKADWVKEVVLLEELGGWQISEML